MKQPKPITTRETALQLLAGFGLYSVLDIIVRAFA
jgi:hypothetical protein